LHHVKKFEELGVLHKVDNYYEYAPSFSKIFNTELEKVLENYSGNKEELEHLFFRRDLLTIALFREIFTHVFFLFQYLEKNLESSDDQIVKKSSSYWKSNPIHYYMYLLNEEDLKEYIKVRDNFFKNLRQKRSESNQSEEDSNKENFILLEAAFPIESYAKYDADKDSHPSIVGDANND
jgi:hypothetical protein